MDYDEIVQRAQKAVPALRDAAADIEQNRSLPSEIVELLRSTGAFRMAMPAAWGGPELTSCQQTEVIEILATGDASAACAR